MARTAHARANDEQDIDAEPARPSRTARAERTRTALLQAAREEFGAVAFHEARISGIMQRAGMAHGTFYTYFASKEEIFRVVLEAVHAEAFPAQWRHGAHRTPLDDINATNRRYLEAWRRHTRVLASFEELASTNDEFAALRRAQRADYIGRTARAIRRWQAAGTVAPTVDADCLAACLGGMVERTAYMTFALGEGSADIDRVLATLDHVWAAALGFTAAPTP